MGAKVLAVVTRLVPVDQFEAAGFVAESAEGERRAGGLVFVFRKPGPLEHGIIHAGLFHAHDAQLTPAGGGHVLDERVFDDGLGLEFLAKVGEKLEEANLGLAFEHDGAGEQTVSQGVLGGGELPGRGDRTAGFGAVGTGGVDLTFGTHTISCCTGAAGDSGGSGEGH